MPKELILSLKVLRVMVTDKPDHAIAQWVWNREEIAALDIVIEAAEDCYWLDLPKHETHKGKD